MLNKPKISVIIPCYNQGRYLAETLNSVLVQTYDNWECIIINDGSTDNTSEIAQNYQNLDARFKYTNIPNGGRSNARNLGLDFASGDYIQFLDSDDIISQDKFEKQLNCFEKNQYADVLLTDYDLFYEIEHRFNTELSLKPYILTLDGFIYNWVNLDFVIAIHCALIKKEFLVTNKIKFYSGIEAIEDWIFWVSIALNNANFYHLQEKLAHYRRHTTNTTNDPNFVLMSFLRCTYVVENMLVGNQKEDFRVHISKIIFDKFSDYLTDKTSKKKANSIDYKIGYAILYPLHFISGRFKKLLSKTQ